MPSLTRTRIFALLALVVHAPQGVAQPKPEFEVASIRPSAPVGPGTQPGCRGGPGSMDPTRFMCEQMTPGLLIMLAYDVKYVQLAGPDWLTAERFDINATVPSGATRDQVPEMWRSLLTHRFQLSAHRESREQTHYDLVVAKGGPKMKPAASGQTLPGATSVMPDGSRRMRFPRMTMTSFAAILGNQLHQLVNDATGLAGAYEVQLQWTPELKVATTADSPPPLRQAVEDQLGLRLEAKKGPVEMLVLDHMDRTPTEN